MCGIIYKKEVNNMIKNLKAQERITLPFLIVNSVKGVTNTGTPYLNITLQDSSGQIEGRKWELIENDSNIFEVGNFVEVNADVISYRNSLQLKILKGEKLDPNKLDVTLFVASSPVPRELLQRKLFNYIEQIKNADIKKIVDTLVKENLPGLLIYPAASRNHHEYASGLLHHTVSMLDASDAIVKVYQTLNSDLLIAGVILHDMGKLDELSGPIIPKYTVEGRLIGHISIMQAKVRETAKKLKIDEEISMVLQHMILSHHGEYEFGSPVLPLIKEAEVLGIIDNLDARINMIDKAINLINEGEFTPRIFSLEERTFYKPKIK